MLSLAEKRENIPMSTNRDEESVSKTVVRRGEKIGRNDPCPCGSGLKYKKCHSSFDDKIEEYRLKGAIVPDRELLKTKEQIEDIVLN